MELFRRAVRIVDDVVLFQSGDTRPVKPDAHYERPEDKRDHWREDGTRQCLSTASQVLHRTVIIPRLSYGGTSGYDHLRDIRGRLYWENTFSYFGVKGVSIPVAVSVFPDELYPASRS